jgi:hypothetical protein
MLEQELEGNWPFWLKTAVNDIIALLEKLYHGTCFSAPFYFSISNTFFSFFSFSDCDIPRF